MSAGVTYDAAVIGAGPAGMAAATALADHGAHTLVIDDQPAPGGQIWRAVEANEADPLARALGSDYRDGLGSVRRFRSANVEYRPSTQMWQLEPGWRIYTKSDGQTGIEDARAVLLATGAQERPAPFPGWTLPGVMTVGAAQILLKSSGQWPSEPVWIAGAGPLPLLYMTQLLELGGQVAGYIDTTPTGLDGSALTTLPRALRGWRELKKGLKWLAQLRRKGVPVYRGASDISVVGDDRIRRLGFRARDGRRIERSASLLLVHEGIIPSIHTTLALNCEHMWSSRQGCYIPKTDARGESTAPGLYVAGDGAGIVGAKAAEVQGRIVGLSMAVNLGFASEKPVRDEISQLQHRFTALTSVRGFLDAVYPPPDSVANLDDDTIVCRCEEVTAGTLRKVAGDNRGGPDQVKAYTRAGMGPCQGRQCGYSVSRILSETYGSDMESVGFFRIRPPLRPVTIGELASLTEEESLK